MLIYVINCKNAKEILTKTLNIYIEKLRDKNDKNAKAKETMLKVNR